MTLRILLAAALLCGCPKNPRIEPPVPDPPRATLLDDALQRTLPLGLRGRFGFKIRSEVLGLSGSTGGVLILDRPGRGHLAVLGPLGGPLVTLKTDGVGLAITNLRGQEHLLVEEADALVLDQTRGVAGIDALLGLLVGELPLSGLEVREQEILEGGDLRVVFSGPQEITVDAVIGASGAVPVSLEARDRQGTLLVLAEYGPFAPMGDGAEPLMPTEVSLNVPALLLELDVQYKDKGWIALEEAPPVFGLEPPEGMPSRSLDVGAMLQLAAPR